MSHPNEYPGKTFVPYEGDMEIKTTPMASAYSEDREGIARVETTKHYAIMHDERQEVFISRIALPQTVEKVTQEAE